MEAVNPRWHRRDALGFFGRWLWVPVLALLLLVVAYSYASLNRLHDTTGLAAEFAEVHPQLANIAARAVPGIGEELDASASAAGAIAALKALRPALAAELGDAEADAAVNAVVERIDVLALTANEIRAGRLDINALALPFFGASQGIDGLLADLSVRSQAITDQLRRVFVGGLMFTAVGAVASALAFAWTSRRAARLRREVLRSRERDRLKSEFVAVASHELRTPLTGILGFSQLLADDQASEAQRRIWAQHIASEATRLTSIVDQLLNVSRIEAGRIEVKTESLQLRGPIERAVAAVMPTLDRHEIRVEGDLDVAVVADEAKLLEVLGNLIDNAVKYSPDGGVVRISAAREGGELRVSVTDSGVGIPEDQLPLLFQRFQRVPNPRTEHVRSSGLGLYVTKQLVERMGGSVAVHSQLRRGSTFSFSLVLEADALAELPVPGAAVGTSAA